MHTPRQNVRSQHMSDIFPSLSPNTTNIVTLFAQTFFSHRKKYENQQNNNEVALSLQA
jgi:hypothetical protein